MANQSPLLMTHGGPTDARPHRLLQSGQGSWVRDRSGRRYLDASATPLLLGYGHQGVRGAIAAQVDRLPSGYPGNGQATEVTYGLAERLLDLMPGYAQACFDTSGSAAVDGAIRLALYYHRTLGRPTRTKVLALGRTLHGHTGWSAAVSAYGPAEYGFPQLPAGTVHIGPPPHTDGAEAPDVVAELVAQLRETLYDHGPYSFAACVIEPIRTAAGVVVPPADYLPAIQRVLAAHEILLVADEVVTGLCRTGPFTATGRLVPRPDLLVLGSGLTAGYVPMAAVLLSPRVADGIAYGATRIGGLGFGSSSAGHPVASAAAHAVLDVLTGDELDPRTAGVLRDGLADGFDEPIVTAVRQRGLLAAVRFTDDGYGRFDGVAYRVAERAADRGLLVRPSGDTVLIAPPLTATAGEVELVCTRLAAAVADVCRTPAEYLPVAA